MCAVGASVLSVSSTHSFSCVFAGDEAFDALGIALAGGAGGEGDWSSMSACCRACCCTGMVVLACVCAPHVELSTPSTSFSLRPRPREWWVCCSNGSTAHLRRRRPEGEVELPGLAGPASLDGDKVDTFDEVAEVDEVTTAGGAAARGAMSRGATGGAAASVKGGAAACGFCRAVASPSAGPLVATAAGAGA